VREPSYEVDKVTNVPKRCSLVGFFVFSFGRQLAWHDQQGLRRSHGTQKEIPPARDNSILEQPSSDSCMLRGRSTSWEEYIHQLQKRYLRHSCMLKRRSISWEEHIHQLQKRYLRHRQSQHCLVLLLSSLPWGVSIVSFLSV